MNPISLLALVVGLSALGCDGKPSTAKSLKARLEAARALQADPKLEVLSLKNVAGLRAALQRDRGRIELKGVSFELRQVFAVRAGTEKHADLEAWRELKIDRKGQYWVREENQWSSVDAAGKEGRGCGFVGGTYYTERLVGPATAVPQHDNEARGCLIGGLEPVSGLLLPHLDRFDYSVSTGLWRGRVVARIQFSGLKGHSTHPPISIAWPKSSRPRRVGLARPPESADSTAIFGPRGSLFGIHARPTALEGSLLLTLETGTPVAADLKAEFVVQKHGRDAQLTVALTLDGQGYGADVPLPEAPQNYPFRPRFHAEHRALLKDLKVKAPLLAPLPKPGDAPKLELSLEEQGQSAEDTPPSTHQDEDTPR